MLSSMQRLAKSRVESVSSAFARLGPTFAISVVIELFVREFCRIRVSRQSRKGTKDFLLISATTQFPRQLRLWLIFFASSNCLPSARDLAARSDPARSHSVRIEKLDYDSNFNCNITCERLLRSFMTVCASLR